MKKLLNSARIVRLGTILIILLVFNSVAYSQFLKRSLPAINEIKSDFSTPTAHYKAVFGAGDDSSSIIKGVTRYGCLSIDSGGSSRTVKYAGEEVLLFIIKGTGVLQYDKEKVPVSKNDFMYIPEGTMFGFSNPRERSLSVMVMGFRIFPGSSLKPTNRLMIANADEVPLQVLSSHGPTTQFKLLMGTTESTRDRLAAAFNMNSLFIMDFAPTGTNIPHRHNTEEEIYFILRGAGDIVAGETADGKELRHPSREGDAYFIPPKTLVGFYSGNKEGEEHALILAVRSKYPSQTQIP